MTTEGDPLHACVGVSADELDALLALIAETEVTELDVTLGPTHLSLRRSASRIAAPARNGLIEAPEAEPSTLAVASPLVGIFRTAVSPGDAVEHGEPVGAIEALGIPTTIDAPQSGTIEGVLVKNGDPVEYGQPLVILRRISKEAEPPWTPGGTDGAP